MSTLTVMTGCALAVAVLPIEEVQVTATRRASSTIDVTAAVAVVNDEQLRNRAPRTVADHLRGEPGVFVQQTTPGQGTIILRGLKGSEVLHLVDGFRLNNAIFRNAPNQYLALVDPWNLERIEVVRGPMSVLYGGDAMGGAVQFFSRAPSFEMTETDARLKVGVQSESATRSFASYVEGEIGNERWLGHVGASWQRTGLQRIAGGYELPHTDYGFRALHARVQLHPDPQSTMQAQIQLSEQPKTHRYDALEPGYGQTQPDFAEHVFQPQQRTFAQLRWSTLAERSLADSTELQLGYQRIRDARILRDFGSSQREAEDNQSDLFGISAHLLKRLAGHDLTYGVEGYYDIVSAERERIDLDTGDKTAHQARFPDGSSMSWLAAYAQDAVSISQSFGLNAGIRYSRYQIELGETSSAPGARLNPNAWSWMLGGMYHASEHTHWVVSIGRAFRPPNIFDLGTLGARQNRFMLPNPDLKSESVYSYEIGLKHASARLAGEIHAFAARYTDKITQVLLGYADENGRHVVQSRNATRLTLSGLEAGLTYSPRESLQVSAAVTWTHGAEEFDGEVYPADRIPPLTGELRVRMTPLGTGRFEWGTTLNWASTQDRLSPRDAIDPRIDPEGTGGWYTLGLFSHFRPSAALALTVAAENVLDRLYREHGSGFDAPGRNFWVRAEWTL